jgi:carbamate kinase
VSRTVVVAVGGNALTLEGQAGTAEEQRANARGVARAVAGLARDRYRIVMTHGNGPQVGALARQQELGAAAVPCQPLCVLGAMTQGQIGHTLALALRDTLGPGGDIVCVVTHVRVDKSDPAFAHPVKPIGPFLPAAEARALAARHGWRVAEDSGRGHRRVVASPRPLEIVEGPAIRLLAEAGFLVIAAGGGGVPVVAGEGGELEGIDAVIDKDRAAERLAVALGAEVLVLTTAVPSVQVDFGTERARALTEVTAGEAERHLAGGQFPPGSMGPKVEAAVSFVRGGGEVAIITSPEHVVDAVAGRHGTRIVR